MSDDPINLTQGWPAYEAFPFVTAINSSFVGIFSTGLSHGNSRGQGILRADLVDTDFRFRTGMFFEKPNKFDLTLLKDLLEVGESITLKVWCVKRDAAGYKILYRPSAFYSREKYSLWSRPFRSEDGTLYRTGYYKSKTQSKSAVFQSLDLGENWTFASLPFSNPQHRFSESDIARIGQKTWLAVCREDGAGDRGMYSAYSYDEMQSWTEPKKFDLNLINGTQPNLLLLNDNSLILCAGDRTGESGLDKEGKVNQASDLTGISLWRSTDGGKNWGNQLKVGPIYSTDGGQPMACQIDSERIIVFFYRSAGSNSNSDINVVRVRIEDI